MAQRKLKPTEVYDVDSVRYSNTDIESKYKDGMENGGKWIMFVDKKKLDEVWEKCCQLYDDDKLTGVCRLKCSTNFKNPRTRCHDSGAIRFYCGPAEDEEKIMEIGRNILKFIPYQCNSGHMPYKSNEQTKLGTRVTGQKVNHVYKIAVARKSFCVDDFNQMTTSFARFRTYNTSTAKKFSPK